MATLVKTSNGGFNLENVTNWTNRDWQGRLTVWITSSDSEGQTGIKLEGNEADRVIEILESVCLFDATSPKQKG